MTPIERVTERGISTSARDYDIDIIVYATGFDALTGSFDAIDIRGVDGASLREKWKDGPSTYLGMFVHGFPNLLMPSGPQSASATTNFPRGIETGVNWCTALLEHMRASGYVRVDATAEAQRGWGEDIAKLYEAVLLRNGKGWFTGYNSNVPGHEAGKPRALIYNGGTPKYVARITDVAEKGYEGVVLSSARL